MLRKVGSRVKVKDAPEDYIDKRNKSRTGTVLKHYAVGGLYGVQLDVHPKGTEIKFMAESLEDYVDP